MEDIASKKRNQPAPPGVIFDDLCRPVHPGRRQWLHLLDDEIVPTILESDRPNLVVWSSLWVKRPDARIRFDLPPGGGGTDLRWTLLLEPPDPNDSLFRHICQRIGELINANLRYTYGQ